MKYKQKGEIHLGRLLACVILGAAIWLSPVPAGLEDPKAWQCFSVFAATILALLLKPMAMGPSVLCGLTVLAAGNVLGNDSKESLKGFFEIL